MDNHVVASITNVVVRELKITECANVNHYGRRLGLVVIYDIFRSNAKTGDS